MEILENGNDTYNELHKHWFRNQTEVIFSDCLNSMNIQDPALQAQQSSSSPERKEESENEGEALALQPVHTPTSSDDSNNSSGADDECETPLAQFNYIAP